MHGNLCSEHTTAGCFCGENKIMPCLLVLHRKTSLSDGLFASSHPGGLELTSTKPAPVDKTTTAEASVSSGVRAVVAMASRVHDRSDINTRNGKRRHI